MSTYHKTKEQIEAEYELIRRAQANPERFGPLYERYYKPIFVFIYRRVDDEDITADLTSLTFIKTMNSLPKFEFRGLPFSAWLYRIASNEVNLYFRQSNKERSISIDDEGLDRLENGLHEEMQLDLDKNNDEELLLSCMHELSADDVAYIELRFFEDRAFKEIAEIMGITENNAKVKTYRILDKLKNVFLQKRK